MPVLPLLQDGSCSVQNTCLTRPDDVHSTCPQAFKCGTCVAWSPREKNRFTRNSGQCLLDRNATQYLDCNAPICPYYRPRSDNPAAEQLKARPAARTVEVRRRTTTMTREAPPPSREAVARASFANHDDDVASIGVSVLAALLSEPLPALLERFRGGSVRVRVGDDVRELPIEALWARLVRVRRALIDLDAAVAASSIDADTKGRIDKDIGGIAGSMTTFNLLFARKEDAFKGSGKGD